MGKALLVLVVLAGAGESLLVAVALGVAAWQVEKAMTGKED